MRQIKLFSKPFFHSVFYLAVIAPSSYIFAQEEVEYFDDFSADSIQYIVDDRPRDGVERSYEISHDGILMRVSGTADNQGNAEIWISERTDVVRTRFSLSSETDLPIDDDGDVKLRISGVWYNEIQDGGFGNRDRTGDVYGQARIRLRGTERREFSLCLDRELADGSGEGVEIFDGDNCISMPGFELQLDTVYEVHMALDREASTIAFGIDGREIVTPIGQPVYLPSVGNKQIALTHEGISGEAVAFVSAIGTGGALQDFSSDPLVSGPYRPLFDLEAGNTDLDIVEGRAQFEVRGSSVDRNRLGLTFFGTSNRIEGELELSSQSIVPDSTTAGEEFVLIRLGGTFYNDTAEGGFNESEGNVFAAIILEQKADSSRTLEYCLFRSNTADFSDSTELVMRDGTECGDFGFSPALDIAYPTSILTDLDAGTVTFIANGIERVHTISTAAYKPANDRQFINVQARASTGSTVVAYLDHYGTSSSAPLVAEDSGEETTDMSNVCVDTDGDGWGWDGARTCIVTNPSTSSTDCVDSDGDGWGWDGARTCTVTNPSTSSTDCVDTDGDGWGWDGTRSCRP